MKHLRQLCAIALLIFVFALPAFAGDIDCGDVPPPPVPPALAMGDVSTGITTTNGTSSTEDAFVDPVTEFTLNILQSALLFF